MTGFVLLSVVVVAGALGAVVRVVVESVVTARAQRVPLAVPLINVSGSMLLGLLTGAVLFRGSPDTLVLIVGTGFCGGYTTFSTAMVHAVRLVQQGRAGAAAVSVAGTAVLSIGSCALGMGLMSL